MTTGSQTDLFQSIPNPTHVWEDVTIDFVKGLPMSNEYNSILVVMDRLIKFVHFVHLVNPYTTKSVAKLYVKKFMKLHEKPRSVVIDRDMVFMINF